MGETPFVPESRLRGARARRNRSPATTARRHRWRRSLATTSPTFDHQLLAGEAWLGAKEYSRALGWFDKARAKQPNNALVYYYSAQCKTSLNQLNPAITDLQQALKIGASGKLRTQVYNQGGYVYDKKKDYNNAISWYQEAGNQKMVAQMQVKQGTRPPRTVKAQRGVQPRSNGRSTPSSFRSRSSKSLATWTTPSCSKTSSRVSRSSTPKPAAAN